MLAAVFQVRVQLTIVLRKNKILAIAISSLNNLRVMDFREFRNMNTDYKRLFRGSVQLFVLILQNELCT